MRSGPLLVCVALLLGCGSSGGDAISNEPVKGVIAGKAFTPPGIVAFKPAIDTCEFEPGVGRPALALFVVLSGSFETAAIQDDPCAAKASSADAIIGIWRSVTSGEIAPGTYPRRDEATNGQVVFEVRYDSACQHVLNNVLSVSGDVVISETDATHVKGGLKVTFPNGDHLDGQFDAPVVASRLSVCEWFGVQGGTPGPGCESPVCVP